MTKSKLACLIALAVTLPLTGCISSNKTEFVDETKLTITFESSKAEADFLAGVERRKASPSRFERPEERTTVFLVVVNVSRRKITSGPNRDFNQCVRSCDADVNSIISEREAELFLKNSPLPKPAAETAIKTN